MISRDKEVVSRFFHEHIFGWMYHDIRAASSGKANFLAALGLSEYTEIMGGLKTGNLLYEGCSRTNYEAFLPYLGQPYLDINLKLSSKGGLYKIVRCGLVHEYFIKGPHVIKNNPDKPADNPIWDSYDCGIQYNGEGLYFIVNVYFRDFKKGVEKFHRELIDGKGIDVFKECLKAIFERQKVRGPTVLGSSGTVFDRVFYKDRTS